MNTDLPPRIAAATKTAEGRKSKAEGAKAWLLAAILLAAGFTAGCARRYEITQTNGAIITARTRPVLDKENDCYRFKDALGKERAIPSVRVRQIETK